MKQNIQANFVKHRSETTGTASEYFCSADNMLKYRFSYNFMAIRTSRTILYDRTGRHI